MTCIIWLAKNVGTIPGFLTEAECGAYIRLSEEIGYDEATVNSERGQIMLKQVRNNDRVIIDDESRASVLFARLAPFVPARFKSKWRAVGLNERLRLYRYASGQKFDWHLDGCFERPTGERSFFTFMVYLNADFVGGATSFRATGFGKALERDFQVTPASGMALIFHHPIEHRGDEVIAGRKYVLRSDVMYARRTRSAPLSAAASE